MRIIFFLLSVFCLDFQLVVFCLCAVPFLVQMEQYMAIPQISYCNIMGYNILDWDLIIF